MMMTLLVLMVVLAVHSMRLPGAREGLQFYLIPDLSKVNAKVAVGAMNQAFFTLSAGMGAMAIFGSYIDKTRSLAGEAVHVIVLDTFVAVIAGLAHIVDHP
jgi:NSS family neurotransmitter:Na+ symporter